MSLVPFYADANGAIYDAPGYRALARMGDAILPMDEEAVIPLPEGADMVFLPERPVRFDLIAAKAVIPAKVDSLAAASLEKTRSSAKSLP